MMNEKKQSKRIERISLSDEAHMRLMSWMEDVTTTYQGIKIRKRELVEWLLLSHPPTLSRSEKKDIKDRFFDELQFAEWMVRKLRKASGEGKKLTVRDLLSTGEKKTKTPKATHRVNTLPAEKPHENQ